MKKFILFVSALSLLFASCSDDSASSEDINTSQPVKFTGVVSNLKISGTSWESGDQISVVMKKNGHDLNTNTALLGADNHVVSIYKTASGDGIFLPDTDMTAPLYYPQSGESVDFIAFHPTGAPPSNEIPIRLSVPVVNPEHPEPYNLAVDLIDQSNQKVLDLIYSNNLTNCSASNPGSQLQFKRKMSKVEFNISTGEGFSDGDLVGLETHFYGPSTMGMFDLNTGQFFSLQHYNGWILETIPFWLPFKSAANGQFAEATLFPEDIKTTVYDEAIKGPVNTRVEFKFKSGDVYTWSLPNGITFEAGKRYIYNIMIKKANGGTKVAVEINQATITDWDTATNDTVHNIV